MDVFIAFTIGSILAACFKIAYMIGRRSAFEEMQRSFKL